MYGPRLGQGMQGIQDYSGRHSILRCGDMVVFLDYGYAESRRVSWAFEEGTEFDENVRIRRPRNDQAGSGTG
jgi:hypothetical protein